jgi:hypothetical protein
VPVLILAAAGGLATLGATSEETAAPCRWMHPPSLQAPPASAHVIAIDAYPVPEGVRLPFVVGRPQPGRASLPLRDVARWIPNPLPAPLAQPTPLPVPAPQISAACIGGMVDLSLSDGETVSYGPVRVPPAIDRLLNEASRTWYRLLARPVPGAPPGTLYSRTSLIWMLAADFEDIHATVIQAHFGRTKTSVELRGQFTCLRCVPIPPLQNHLTRGTRLTLTISTRTLGLENVRLVKR